MNVHHIAEISPELQADTDLLESKIASLIDEFQKKHKPVQVSVLTRWRDVVDRYQMKKGGEAQIILHDLSPMSKSLPTTRLTDHYFDFDGTVYYTDMDLSA